jgi:hypothetical protein
MSKMQEIMMAQAVGDEFESWGDGMLGLFECWDVNKPKKTILFKGIISVDLYLDWLNESKKYEQPVFVTSTYDCFKSMKKISKVKDSMFILRIDDFWVYDMVTEESSDIIESL